MQRLSLNAIGEGLSDSPIKTLYLERGEDGKDGITSYLERGW